MIEHNWGQVPVSDPINGEVIGIVTRTDLLNSLANGGNSQSRRELANKLEQALTAERLALLELIAAESEASNVALYIVGGSTASSSSSINSCSTASTDELLISAAAALL